MELECMTDKTKCYVCSYYYGGGEYSEQKRVFWYRKDAEAWVNEDDDFHRVYKEMEIE